MTRSKKEIQLPQGTQAIGLSEEQFARSWGISPSQIRELRRLNPDLLPRARRAGTRKLYSRTEAEEKFHQLPFWDEDESDGGAEDEWSVN